MGEAQDVTELVDQDLGQLDLLVSDRLRGEDEGHSLVGERELRVDENVPAGACKLRSHFQRNDLKTSPLRSRVAPVRSKSSVRFLL